MATRARVKQSFIRIGFEEASTAVAYAKARASGVQLSAVRVRERESMRV